MRYGRLGASITLYTLHANHFSQHANYPSVSANGYSLYCGFAGSHVDLEKRQVEKPDDDDVPSFGIIDITVETVEQRGEPTRVKHRAIR